MHTVLPVSSLQQSGPPGNFSHPPQKYIGTYIIDYSRLLGQGNFSSVYMTINVKEPKVLLATKVINMNKMKEQML